MSRQIDVSVVKNQQCLVCNHMNDVLALTCEHCGAFLRDRVPGVNLFSTLYGLLLSPKETLLRIARSEQKNYTVTLFAFTGPSMAIYIFMIGYIGISEIPFPTLLFATYIIGPVVGIAFLFITMSVMRSISRSWTARPSRSMSAVILAYACSPLCVMSLIIVPIQLGIFGSGMLSTNPTPYSYKPLEFWSLAGFHLLSITIAIMLAVKGFELFQPKLSHRVLAVGGSFLFLALLIVLSGLFLRSLSA